VSATRPTAGVRFAVERVEEEADGGAFVYRGFVHAPDGDLALEVRVERPSGVTRATVEGADAKLEAQAAALVRAATKSALSEGVAPPRKIVRWRG
jgi:hypothetical protein